jgi:hypothetical protein
MEDLASPRPPIGDVASWLLFCAAARSHRPPIRPGATARGVRISSVIALASFIHQS